MGPSVQPLQAAPGVTAMAGEVRMLSDQPLEGVTLRIGNQRAQTDKMGRFLLISISSGHSKLLIDGRTSSKHGQVYGVFIVGVDVRAGLTNILPYTIWMPEIDTENVIPIQSPTPNEIVATTPHLPGLELHLPPGTTIYDQDHRIVTEISITPIPIDRPPFPLPLGALFPMYFTVQPGGARIEPYGAKIIYPNVTDAPPGTRIDYWNYDAEEKGWYCYGRGTVTPDGKQVVPDQGVYVYELVGFSRPPDQTGSPPGGDSGVGPWGTTPTDGEPVDLATGIFIYNKTDLILPDVMPIALTRTHRQSGPTNGALTFGVGSGIEYEMYLLFGPQFQELDLILPAGSRVHYNKIAGTENTNAIFEHISTPTVFFKSRIQEVHNTWELTLKDGRIYTFSSSSVPLLMSITDRYGNRISIARGSSDPDQHAKISRVISPSGRWLEFTLDSDGVFGKVIQARDNTGRIVTYNYDDSGRLMEVRDPSGGLTEFTYGSSNEILTIKDARGIIFLTNEYDDKHRVIKQTQADGSTFEFEYTINPNGKITQTLVTDPGGNIRKVTFNADGYIMTDTRALGTSEEQTIIYEREAVSNLVLSATDNLGRKSAYSYDLIGNMTTFTHLENTPEAMTTAFTYEPKFNQPTGITDPAGLTTTCLYDEQGNLTALTALGKSTILAYNASGQLVSVTDSLGRVVRLTYNFGIRNSLINPGGATTSIFSDSAGRPIALTNRLGQSSSCVYDAHNRITQMTDSLGEMTTFSYDPNGNLLSVTDARGSVTNYAYDSMDRLVSRTDPLGRSESYQYNQAGNITQFTDRKGQTIRFTFDALNRLSQKIYSDGATITYTYDSGNRLIKVIDSISGMITFNYDNLDRLIAETTPQGSVHYGYDASMRRISMTVTGQTPVTYTYDDFNRLIQISQGVSAVSIAYDAADRPLSLTFPGDVIIEYGYDEVSQLTNITYRRAGSVLGDLIYGYDDAGNRIRIGGSFARTNIPDSVSAMVYDTANQLIQQDSTSLSYDSNGNLINDGIRTYTWDARDQLSSINGGGVTATFNYDAFGRRARKTVNGITTEYIYDGLNIVHEISGGTPTATLLTGLGIDEYFIRATPNSTQIMLFDALGSILGLLDVNGGLQTEYSYEPFGATTATGMASTNPFQYTGRENDGSGLYSYRFRYYSPTLGRFISEDPLGFDGGDINLYAYVQDSPTNFTDPLGLGDVGVGVLDAADCLDMINDARKRQKRIETSTRKGNEVEKIKEAIEEINKTIWETIKCLAPLGMASPFLPFYPRPPLPDQPPEWPKGDDRYDTPISWQRGREEWNRKYGGKEIEDAIQRYAPPKPGRLKRFWQWLRRRGRR